MKKLYVSGYLAWLLAAWFCPAAIAAAPTVGQTEQAVETMANKNVTVTLSEGQGGAGPLIYKITTLPAVGKLYQYDAEADGKKGVQITAVDTKVTDTGRRVVYAPVLSQTDYADIFAAKVNDGTEDSADAETVTITVKALPPAPHVGKTEQKLETPITELLTVQLSVGVSSGGPLVYKITSLPTFGRIYQFDPAFPKNKGAEITMTGTELTDTQRRVIYEPGLLDANHEDRFGAKVNDGFQDSPDTETVIITVIYKVNHPPYIGTDPAKDVFQTKTVTAAEKEDEYAILPQTLLSVQLTLGTDEDEGDVLTYRLITFPDPEMGKLYQYETGGKKGDEITETKPIVANKDRLLIYETVNRDSNYTVEFSAKVNDGEEDSPNTEFVTIQVSCTNQSPKITSSPPSTVSSEKEYNYIVTAEDPDANDPRETLTVSAVKKPDWLTLQKNEDGTTLFSGTPGAANIGTHHIVLRVTDDSGLFDAEKDQKFTIIVIPPEVKEIIANELVPPNEIIVDTTWDYDKVVIKSGGGPNVLTVMENATLVIPAGTLLEFEDNMRLILRGGMLAEGKSDKKITFKGTEWGGILFNGSQKPSVMKYCQIEGVKGIVSGGVGVVNYSDLIMENCTISKNEGVYGAGIYLVNASPTLTGNTITGNKFCEKGGGIYCKDGSPILTGNTISGNTDCKKGAGLYLENCNAKMQDNFITQNMAHDGGGLYIDGGAPELANLIIANNNGTVDGGGLFLINASPKVTSCTIAANLSLKGPGIFCLTSSPVVKNTVVYTNHIADEKGADTGISQQIWLGDSGSVPSFLYSNVEGGTAGIGGSAFGGTYKNCTEADPLFFSPAAAAGAEGSGTWTVKAESPCINTGAPDMGGVPAADIAGIPRPFNGVRADMGAHEFRNNPPVLDADSRVLEGADEKNGILFSLNNLVSGTDPDGDDVRYKILSLPEYGKLYQVKDGNKDYEIQLVDDKTDIFVSDPQNLLYYEPINRSADYTVSFSYKVKDDLQKREDISEEELLFLPLDSFGEVRISIGVKAENEAPFFVSTQDIEAKVGNEYSYEIEVADPDTDHTGEFLKIWAEKTAPWQALTDKGDGTGLLSGIPAQKDLGMQNVNLRVTDALGAFAQQDFIITVIFPNELSVNGGEDQTGEPGTPLFLTASGQGSDTIIYEWTIQDKNANMVKSGEGQTFSWTPEQGGMYTAIVRVRDEFGSLPGSDRVQLAIAEGFAEAGDERRDAPTSEQESMLENLSATDSADPDFDKKESIEAISELSELNLSAEQQNMVLKGMEEVLESGELTQDEASQMMGAADNLIIESADEGSRLTAEQRTRMLHILNGIADIPEMTEPQVFKMMKTLGELLRQQGTSGLSAEEIGLIDEIARKTFRKAADLKSSVTADGYEYVKIYTQTVDTSSPAPVRLGGNSETDARFAVSEALIAEIRQKTGVKHLTVCFLVNAITDGHGVLVCAEMTNDSKSVLSLRNLANPAEIAIPVINSSRRAPMYFNTSSGFWLADGIAVMTAGDKIVVFTSRHLTDFMLFESQTDPTIGDERNDGEKVVEAVSDIGSGGGGCFMDILWK